MFDMVIIEIEEIRRVQLIEKYILNLSQMINLGYE